MAHPREYGAEIKRVYCQFSVKVAILKGCPGTVKTHSLSTKPTVFKFSKKELRENGRS